MAKAKAKAKKSKKSTTKAQSEINSTKKKVSDINSKTEKKVSGAISGAQKKSDKMMKDYKNGKAYKNAENLQNMTIDDIAKKYGFDFSQEYADRQAETAAQGQRNVYNSQQRTNDATNKTTMQRISDNYDSAAGDLDKGYFKQYLGTQQSQANRGLNAGIAANQNLQLAMNKQGEVADLWKQRNTNTQEEDMRYANQNQTISEALAQVEKEKAINAQKIHQDLLAQGYGILSSDRASATSWANNELGMTQNQINNMMDLTGMNVDNWNKSADRNISSTLDLSKMTVADIYNEQQRADAAAARAAAAAASRRRSYGGGGSGGSGGSGGGGVKTPLSPKKNEYDTTVKSQQQSNLDKYYSPPVPQRPGYLKSTYGYPFNAQPSVNNNQTMTAWDKKRMLGL